MKIDFKGEPIVESVEAPFTKRPPSCFLYQNHPNPFNHQTKINFSLLRPEKITLNIYNGLGRHIRTLVNGTIPTGTHTLVWNGREQNGTPMETGIYFYRFSSKKIVQTGKMQLIR